MAMITEETGQRLAVALERLIVLLEKQAPAVAKGDASRLDPSRLKVVDLKGIRHVVLCPPPDLEGR